MARRSLLSSVLCAVVVAGAARFPAAAGDMTQDWAGVATGATTVTGVGRVAFFIGYSSVGYDHFRSEIVVGWHDGGARRQTIYDGIYDRPPARIWGIGGHLCLSMQACARYEDVCTTQTLAFRYDPAATRFDELTDSGRCAE